MNAISSHRPLSESPAIALNQLAAKTTWNHVFNKIIYFGYPEEGLAGDKTFFIPFDGKPPIVELAGCASMSPSWCCIINADILVERKAVELEAALDRVGAKCGFSFRIPCGDTEQRDLGIDFFVAKPEIWAAVAANIPHEFQLGKIVFDTWLLSFFTAHWIDFCFDISPSRLIWHPVHGERIDQNMTVHSATEYLQKVRWPKHYLKI